MRYWTPKPTRGEKIKAAAQGAGMVLLMWAAMLLAVIC
jgi:hypothetical protein